MRDNHDQRVITLFGGERIAPGYRGRCNSPQIAIKLIALALGVAFIGLATAATAIAVRHTNDTERSIRAGGNLAGGVSGSVGFEAALY
jgi:hypothetical protein